MLRNLSVCYGLDLIFGFLCFAISFTATCLVFHHFSTSPVFNQTATDRCMYNPCQTVSLLQPFSSMYCLHVCILFLAYQGIISCLFLPLICPLPDSFPKLAYVFVFLFFCMIPAFYNKDVLFVLPSLPCVWILIP